MKRAHKPESRKRKQRRKTGPPYAIAPKRHRRRRVQRKIDKRHGMATYAGARSWRILDRAQAALAGLTDATSELMAPTNRATEAFAAFGEALGDVSMFDQPLTAEEQAEFDAEFNRE